MSSPNSGVLAFAAVNGDFKELLYTGGLITDDGDRVTDAHKAKYVLSWERDVLPFGGTNVVEIIWWFTADSPVLWDLAQCRASLCHGDMVTGHTVYEKMKVAHKVTTSYSIPAGALVRAYVLRAPYVLPFEVGVPRILKLPRGNGATFDCPF